MYVVTNKAKDVRKFRDSFLGKDVLVNPGESTFTKKPPVENNIWKVEKAKNIEKKEKKELNNTGGKKMRVKENDSGSS